MYAAGFSRINWHIWTSQWSPEAVFNPSGTGGGWGTPVTSWPGFQSMSMFNTLGLREPCYEEYWEFNQHLGRVQELLREGKRLVSEHYVWVLLGLVAVVAVWALLHRLALGKAAGERVTSDE